MKPLSLRGRLVLGAVGLLAVGLIIANLTVLGLFRDFQLRQVDEQLRTPFGSDPPAELRSWLAQACEPTSGASPQIPTDFALLIVDASHELRTPLATIRGHAELARTGIASTPEEISRVLNRIEAESIRMSILVDDLLLLARLDDTRALEQRPTDLLSIAVDAVTDTRARAPQRQITIHTPTNPPWQDTAPTVLGDPARLQQILTNLLTNAVQHTPENVPIEVEIGVRDATVILTVIDHGPGLATGNEERVFERFFREDPGRGRAHGGAGLGLAIAWTLADKHGGHLTYQQTPGGGSSFRLALPMA